MANAYDVVAALADRLNTCCTENVWGFFSRHTDYVMNLEENLEALKNIIGELRVLKDDVMQRVVVGEQQQMKRLATVGLWFERVDDAIEEGDALLKKGIREVRRLCLGGYCSFNCWATSNFGKRMDKCLKNLATLKATGEMFGGMVVEQAPKELVVLELPCDATIGLDAKVKEVWRCLEEKNVGIIGLYGIGGIGKTAILTQIHNEFASRYSNQVVIWIAVGKNSKYEDVQAEIGTHIGVLEGSSDEKRVLIYNKLRKKNFVLLLDDVWERVKLNEIGIPTREKLNGSKIVFTTRLLKVCGEMLAQKKIRVEPLEWKHGWELFKKYVGEDTIDANPEILPLAQRLVKKCDGLPIALITVGRAMCCKLEPQQWYHAVETLENQALDLQNLEIEVLEKLCNSLVNEI